jgi:hypothetical protein
MDFSNVDAKGVARRVIRTFLQAFIATYGGANLIAALGGSEEFDVSLLRSAAVSGLVALASLIWNTVLDPSPIPSITPPAEPEEVLVAGEGDDVDLPEPLA